MANIYTMKYKDLDGVEREARLTQADSKEALRNDYQELKRMFNPDYIKIEEIRAAAGEALHIRITVNAPSHYLSSSEDSNPKACNSMSVDIICYLGYPLRGVKAFYPADCYLASPNVFRSGNACIDTWIPFKSSLVSVADKLVKDMIHDPTVTRYDSPANSSMIQWHKDNVAMKLFPTIHPKLLYKPELRPLPPRRSTAAPAKKVTAAPALPKRRR